MKAATSSRLIPSSDGAISIHAAREGGDEVAKYGAAVAVISIHAAREGGDTSGSVPSVSAEKFQSTPPVKAATGIR